MWCAGVQGPERAAYMGRGTKPRYMIAPILPARHALVHGAAAPMNAGTTARVMITIARMAQQLQQNQQAYWATQLALFCCETHPEWVQVRTDLEPLEFMKLEMDIHKAIGITLGAATMQNSWYNELLHSAASTKPNTRPHGALIGRNE